MVKEWQPVPSNAGKRIIEAPNVQQTNEEKYVKGYIEQYLKDVGPIVVDQLQLWIDEVLGEF